MGAGPGGGEDAGAWMQKPPALAGPGAELSPWQRLARRS
jgi:hypothetical protein